MKIQGSLELVQTNLDFYLRLTSTSKYRSVEDLRSHYYNAFLEEAKKGLKSVADSKQEVVDVVDDTVDLFESSIGDDSGNSCCASSFLSAVQSIKDSIDEDVKPVPGLCLDDIIEDTGYTTELQEVHGIILEDYDIGVKSNEYKQEYTSIILEDIHGIILDDYEVDDIVLYDMPSGIPEYKPDIVHGLILDDYIPIIKHNSQVNIEEDYDNQSEGITYEEEYGEYEEDFDDVVCDNNCIDNIADEEIDFDLSYQESSVEEVVGVTETPNNVISISDRIRVVEQQEILPPTVREYLKKHPGARVFDVERLYSKKVVKKELTMGKIYKKGDKLFI